MTVPDPKVGQVYATTGLPGYPDDRKRYAIVVGPSSSGARNEVLLTTLTTDRHDQLGPDEAIPISPRDVPSLFHGRHNRDGLPPADGKISLYHYKAGKTAIFPATVLPTTGKMVTESGDFVSILDRPSVRSNREDWDKIRAACPQSSVQFLADYDAIP